LVCGGQLGPYLCERGRRSVAKVLRKLGVEVLEVDVVTEVRPSSVVFADGAVRQSAVTIWVAGFGVPDLAATSGLRTDAIGRLLTDETLTSVDDPRIVAAGDCASPSGVPLRMSCQSAGPLGTKAADTVLSRVAGSAPAVIDQAFFGACISLGRKSGILQFAHKDDRAVNLSLSGRFVASIKQGGGVQEHAVVAAPRGAQAGFGVLVQRRLAPRAAGVRPGGGHGKVTTPVNIPNGSPPRGRWC
jgi:NADH dehydrogenase